MKKIEMNTTILVVDDSALNRALLANIFSTEYSVVESENGKQALKQLAVLADVAAVILDIHMSVMDGYAVLDAMRSDPELESIPVIVITASDDMDSQIKALDCGAVDVLVKPIHPQIALHRIRNIINRREMERQTARTNMLEELLRQSDIDEKSGIFNKHAFCRRAREFMHANPQAQYVIARWDVNRFKVYNDVFGVAAGDAFLRRVGDIYQEANAEVVYGHWEADHFVLCMTMETFRGYGIERRLSEFLASFEDTFDFSARVGVYVVDDPSIDVALMCDRALMALHSIKNDYNVFLAYYDEPMRTALLEEQEIIGEMGRALTQGQFTVYLQPQYNYASGALHGAEALVRWQHPTKGLIPPNRFIPIFERNGFIIRMDECIWEQVCQLQRGWLDNGLNCVPISVNISRRDLYNPHLVDTIVGLVQKYNLPPALLRLEITESAYMENAEQLIRTVNALRGAGFAVEIDDFGSGYSSLNSLKDVQADTLKLDMKFLEKCQDDAKSGSILTSVIRMAHWIKLPVIAEGVETRTQAEYLKSIGCSYMQGYYFAKPMPTAEFESLLQNSKMDGTDAEQFAGDIEGAVNFLSASTQSTLLFNSFVGGAAILEYDGKRVEMLRLNDSFFTTIGSTRSRFEGGKRFALDYFDEENQKLVVTALDNAIHTGQESPCEVRSQPLPGNAEGVWLRLRLRMLSKTRSRYILYMAVENITQRMQLLERNTHLNERLTAVMNSLPGGIQNLDLSKNGAKLDFFNAYTPKMFGFTEEEYRELYAHGSTGALHPDDRNMMAAFRPNGNKRGENRVSVRFRHICKDGSWLWVQMSGSALARKDGHTIVTTVMQDINEQVKAEQLAKRQAAELDKHRVSLQALYNSIPCGIIQLGDQWSFEGSMDIRSFNDGVWRLFGYESRSEYIEIVHGKNKSRDIFPDDLPMVKAQLEKIRIAQPGAQATFEHRFLRRDGALRWMQVLIQKVLFNDGSETTQMILSDITENRHQRLYQSDEVLCHLFDEVLELDEERMGLHRHFGALTTGSEQRTDLGAYVDSLCALLALPEEEPSLRAFFRPGQTGTAPRQLVYCRMVEGAKHWICSTALRIRADYLLICNRDITEELNAQRQTQETVMQRMLLQERELEAERSRLLVASCELMLMEYDPAADELHLQGAAEKPGVTKMASFLAELPRNEAFAVNDREKIACAFRAAMDAPGSSSLNFRSRRSDGVFQDYHMELSAVTDQAGRVIRVVGIAKPLATGAVSVCAEPDKALQTPNEAAMSAIDASSAFFYLIDPDTYRVVYANQTVKNTRSDIVNGEPCYRTFRNEEGVCQGCPVTALKNTGVSIPVRLSLPNGQPCIMQAIPFRWNGRPVYAVSGTSFAVLAKNPTLVRGEVNRQAARRFARTLSTVYAEVFELNYGRDSYIPHITQAAANAASPQTLTEAIARWVNTDVAPEDRERVAAFLQLANIQKAFATNCAPSLRYALVLRDGSTHICASTLVRLDYLRYLCCNSDVTEQIVASQEQTRLRTLQLQAQDRYQVVVEQTGVAVIEIDFETGGCTSSAAFEQYELSCHEQNIMDEFYSRRFVHPDDDQKLAIFLSTLRQNKGYHAELLRVLMRDGSFHWTRVAGTLLRNGQGGLTRLIATFTDIDDVIRSKLALAHVSNRLNNIIASIPAGVAIYELRDQLYPLYASDRACEMFGIPRQEYELLIANEQPLNSILELDLLTKQLKESFTQRSPVTVPRLHVRRRDSSWFWLQISCRFETTDEGLSLCYAVLTDISSSIARENKYQQQTETYRALMKYADMITFDYSPQEDVMTISHPVPGGSERLMVIKQYLHEPSHFSSLFEEEKQEFIANFMEAISGPKSGVFDIRRDYYGTGFRWYRTRYASLADEDGRVYRLVGRMDDITDLIREQALLKENADNDDTTQTHNKNYAMRTMPQAMRTLRTGTMDALMYIDIDCFKQINDTYGHVTADRALQQVGSILRASSRSSDIVARFGGDEFVVYLRTVENAAAVKSKAARILSAVSSITLGGRKPVHCSIGIALITEPDAVFEEVLKQADEALYHSKAMGKNCFSVVEDPRETPNG